GHDLALDHEALLAALPSPASYVGLLGARRRLAERITALRAAGLTERDLAKLRAPIGLDLGGKAPFEVAIAVIGEIIAARHGQPALERRAHSNPSPLAGEGGPRSGSGEGSKALSAATTDRPGGALDV
ncbi:hypothetical protein DMC25_19420, partial [Caulobacter sp. D4A]